MVSRHRSTPPPNRTPTYRQHIHLPPYRSNAARSTFYGARWTVSFAHGREENRRPQHPTLCCSPPPLQRSESPHSMVPFVQCSESAHSTKGTPLHRCTAARCTLKHTKFWQLQMDTAAEKDRQDDESKSNTPYPVFRATPPKKREPTGNLFSFAPRLSIHSPDREIHWVVNGPFHPAPTRSTTILLAI